MQKVRKNKCTDRRGWNIPPPRRKYKINENCFNQLTPEALYWIGFIVADGYVKSDKDPTNRIKIELQIKDIKHVKKFNKFVGSNKKIDVYERMTKNRLHGVARIEIFSKKIIDIFSSFNIQSSKSKIKIQDKRLINSTDFWRGYFDGDGCVTGNIYKNGLTTSVIVVSVNKDIVIKFRKYIIKNIVKTKAKIIKHRIDNKYTLNIGGNDQVKKIIEHLYYTDCVGLDRKIKRVEQIICKKFMSPY